MKINWGVIAGDCMALFPVAVHAIESIIGESQSGASKSQMAQDAVKQALTGALTVTTGGNAALAQIAAAGVLGGINAGVQISQAVKAGKAAGTYQTATAQGNALQAAITAASTATGSAAAPAGTSDEPSPALVAGIKADPSADAEADSFTPAENAS